MNVTAYNPQKGRLETIEVLFTEDTTTWFPVTMSPKSISMSTDLDYGLLITGDDINYPVIVYDISREGINYSRKKAEELFKQALM